MEGATVSSLMEQYQIPEEDCNRQIRDIHLEEISQSHCEKWRSLPSHLKMKTIIKKDIDRESKSEDEKRLAFFERWQQERGSDATYKALINALLKISCRQDAEKVCELLQKFLSTPEQSAASEAPNSRKDYEISSVITTGSNTALPQIAIFLQRNNSWSATSVKMNNRLQFSVT